MIDFVEIPIGEKMKFTDFDTMNDHVTINGIYVHYKGGAYEVKAVALDVDIQELVVVYMSLESGHWFTRLKSEFLGNTINDDGDEVKRFFLDEEGISLELLNEE